MFTNQFLGYPERRYAWGTTQGTPQGAFWVAVMGLFGGLFLEPIGGVR